MEANSPYSIRHLFCYRFRQRNEILRPSKVDVLAEVESLQKCGLWSHRYFSQLSPIFCEGLQHLEEKDHRIADLIGRLCFIAFGQD